MADKWLDEHIEKELDKAREDGKIQLQQILKEGFFNTGMTASGYLQVYEKDDERIFYDGRKDRIACRVNLNDLMTKM